MIAKWSSYVETVSPYPLVLSFGSRESFKTTLSLMNVFLSVSYYLTPQSYYVFLGMLKSMWILNGKKQCHCVKLSTWHIVHECILFSQTT